MFQDVYVKRFEIKYKKGTSIETNVKAAFEFATYLLSIPTEMIPASVCPYPFTTSIREGNFRFKLASQIEGTAEPAGKILLTESKSCIVTVLDTSYSES